MGTINFKLVSIILAAIVVTIIGTIIVGEILEESQVPSLPFVFLKEYPISAQFISSFYVEDQKAFKLGESSPASLEATYYALIPVGKTGAELSEEIDIEEVFNKIRSYYTPSNYYLEDGKDPLVSTRMALEIDRRHTQDLGQEINVEWLKGNSLENENLEEDKFDTQYQSYILDVYGNIDVDQKETERRLRPLYTNYHCNYSSDQIADEDYLRKKYYQISIISRLTGVQTISDSCLKKEDVEADKARLDKIQLTDLSDIKEIFWFYRLKQFYNLSFDFEEGFNKIGEFYTGGGFKEKLNDDKPNLIGTFYGSSFVQLYFSTRQ